MTYDASDVAKSPMLKPPLCRHGRRADLRVFACADCLRERGPDLRPGLPLRPIGVEITTGETWPAA